MKHTSVIWVAAGAWHPLEWRTPRATFAVMYPETVAVLPSPRAAARIPPAMITF